MRYLTLFILLLSGFAVAGETEHVRMKFEINDEDGNVVSIDSDTMDFDMTEMQVGENRSFVDDAGRNAIHAATNQPRASRAALSRAKSSPAWWEERVNGDEDTIRKPFARASVS